MKIKYTSW